jgi:hypothetical protein
MPDRLAWEGSPKAGVMAWMGWDMTIQDPGALLEKVSWAGMILAKYL